MEQDSKLIPLDVVNPDAPSVPLRSLDAVWFQVGGTVCNLRCQHCFISCSPENDTFGFMTLDTCREHLADAKRLGAKEYYFTGGEPFANPWMCDILDLTLRDFGPATVLTNATLFRDGVAERLADMMRAHGRTLELRVSLDGHSAAMNDPIRGDGTFDRAMEGVAKLVLCGFAPIITITRTWCGCDEEVLSGFRAALRQRGYAEPRLKILPLLKIGAEVSRGGGYCDQARVTHEMTAQRAPADLVCTSSRLVTDRGVWACPILPDSPSARLGETLAESLAPYPLRHAACYTCFKHGAICSNTTTGTPCSGGT